MRLNLLSVTELQPYQQRVVLEAHELKVKLDALHGYLATEPYLALPRDERVRLTKQRDLMVGYLGVLKERIAEFPIVRSLDELRAY